MENFLYGQQRDSSELDSPSGPSRPPSIGLENRKEFYARIRAHLPPPLNPSEMTESQKVSDAHFKKMVKRLNAYVLAHGDARVPLSYPTDPELGQFINSQRKKLKTRSTRQDQFDILNACGFVWQMNKYQQEIPVILDFLPDSMASPSDNRNSTGSFADDESLYSPIFSLDKSGSARSSAGVRAAPAKSKLQRLFPHRAILGSDYDSLNVMIDQLNQNSLMQEYACKPFRHRFPEVSGSLIGRGCLF